MNIINYDGWICGNDEHPTKNQLKYVDKIGKEVFGFNTLAKWIANSEDNWNYVCYEYRINEKSESYNMKIKAWDHYIKIDNRKILVEFDGEQHYTKISNFINDEKYELIALQLGYEIVRIPYFIQLNTELINYFFKTKLKNTIIINSFFQGFRTNGKNEIPEFIGTKAENFVNSLGYK
ncbi:MAG: hypothetical protein ACK5LY_00960, partial [Lachnospirales bacterium]